MPKKPAGPARFGCPIATCDAGPFDTVQDLQEHMYDAHEADRPRLKWACRHSGCGQTFTSEGDRNLHELEVHGREDLGIPTATGARTFVCGVKGCRSRFENVQRRGAHRRHEHKGWTADDVDQSLLDPREVAHGGGKGAVERAKAIKEREVAPDPEPEIMPDLNLTPEPAATPEVQADDELVRSAVEANPGSELLDVDALVRSAADAELEAEAVAAAEADPLADPMGDRRMLFLEALVLHKDDADALEALAFLEDRTVEAVVARAIRLHMRLLLDDEVVVAAAKAMRTYRDRHKEEVHR